MNKIIILIMGIFVMAGLVYALATFTAAGGGLVGHWALDGESYDSNTERITDKTPYENHGTNSGATLTTDRMGQSDRAMSFDVNEESLILNYMIWKDGQTGSVGSFSRNGDITENYRIIDRDPWGRQVVVWEARPDNVSGADGGWNHAAVAIDNTKLYRFSTWVNLKVKGANGRFYLGTNGYGTVNGVIRLSDNTTQTNPYFWHSLGLPEDEWVLVVGHVYPYTHTGTSNHPDSGRYYANGTKLGSISYDYKWLPETTSGRHRSYLYYCTDISVRQHWIYPRVNVVDGTEPSIEELLDGYDNYGNDIVAEVVEDKESFSFWYINNSNGNWTHVVNSSGTLYVNGELGTPNQYPLYVSENNVYIGRTTASDFFNGSISDVRIYNRALSADEIDTLYHSYRPKTSSGSLQKGLAGHWTLDAESYDSNTERITDKTPYSNHGTVYGAVLTTDQMGQSDRAMYFDGKTARDRISFGSFTIGTTGTYNLWIKGDKTAGVQRSENIYPLGIQVKHSLLGPSGGVNGRYGLITDDGTNRYYDWGNQDVYDNKWHMYTVAWDGTYVYAWLDGVSVGAPKAHSGQIFSGTGNFYAGAGWSSTYGTHTGELGEVRLYDQVLSADEIDTLYQTYRRKASAGSLHKGLVLDMPLKFKYTKDETAGSEILTDRTPYSNDGQNYGATVGSDYTSFDGVDDYVTFNSITLSNESATISWWMSPSQYSIDNGSYLFTNTVGDSYNSHILNNYGGKKIFMESDTNCNGPYWTTDYTEIGWHHWTVVFDNALAYLYIDGVLEGEADSYGAINCTGGTATSVNNDMTLSVIGYKGTYVPLFNGSRDEVRIYNRALSAQEIKLLYDKGR